MPVENFPQHVSHANILEHQAATVLVVSRDQQLRYINPAGEVLFRQSARQLLGRPVHELVLDAGQMLEQLDKTISRREVISQTGCRLVLPDGEELRVSCTFTPMAGAGAVEDVLIELRTVDHQMRIEQEESLMAQQRVTTTLVRGLAHEIKNPLGGLRGAAQLLEGEISDPELREYTRIIIGEADRLQALMDRMLGPNQLPNIQTLNIHVVLERVRELVQMEGGSELVIRQDYDPSLPELQGDPDMLVQATLNIVRNAAQAIDNNGEITLRTRVLRNFNIGSRKYRLVMRIEIIDNGPGIPEDLQRQVFYPMITGRSDGTGLGLSISQSLVSRHNGLIECESEPGRTIFTILLPLEGNHESR